MVTPEREQAIGKYPKNMLVTRVVLALWFSRMFIKMSLMYVCTWVKCGVDKLLFFFVKACFPRAKWQIHCPGKALVLQGMHSSLHFKVRAVLPRPTDTAGRNQHRGRFLAYCQFSLAHRWQHLIYQMGWRIRLFHKWFLDNWSLICFKYFKPLFWNDFFLW